MKKTNYGRVHWICEFDEQWNHNSRKFCLRCGKAKTECQLLDAQKLAIIHSKEDNYDYAKNYNYCSY